MWGSRKKFRIGGALVMNHIHKLGGSRIMVIGDVMLDSYWYGTATRISPEAPVPIVNVRKKESRIGGAGNVALNAMTLGAKVVLLGLIGDDASGNELCSILEKYDIKNNLKIVTNSITINKLRIVTRNQQVIRLDFENYFPSTQDKILFDDFDNELDNIDIVIISDYKKGTIKNIQSFITAASSKNVKVIIDPKGNDYSIYRGAHLITPNLAELELVIGSSKTESELRTKTEKLRKYLNIDSILLTRSENGMTLFDSGKDPINVPTVAQEVFDVTGAGDTVIATMAVAISAGINIVDAMQLANYAAGVAVSKLGTSTVTVKELTNAIHRVKNSNTTGILKEQELFHLITTEKAKGNRVIMTNGCFDILNSGHVEFLEKARESGDLLIVAVNDDDSVRRLKGQGRPINDLHSRMKLLSALTCVDWVVSFSEDTPESLYSKVLPDVIVKGGDYKEEEVAGGLQVKAAGGKVTILSFKDGFSTTKIINRINNLNS